MHTVGRWGLRVPDGSDGPPNVPLWMDRLAVDLTDVAKDNQGTLLARPTSTVLSPGVSGRYFVTTDELDAGAARRRVYRDAGTAWDELATLPVSRRMVDSALSREFPSSLLTVAQFLALPAQPDGTVVRVQLLAPAAGTAGVNLRLRLNAAEPSAYKWESDPRGAFVYVTVDTEQSGSAFASSTWSDLATLGPDYTTVLAGDYLLRYGAMLQGGLNGQTVRAGIAKAAGAVPVGKTLEQSQVGTGALARDNVSTSDTFTALAVGTLLRMRYYVSPAGGTPTAGSRFIEVVPLRVGGPAVA